MNAGWLTADMAEAGNEALWRSNPVLCLDRLIAIWKRSDAAWLMSGSGLASAISTLRDHDIVLPAGVAHRWAPGRQISASGGRPEPRVIGLAVDESRTGYVFPLQPARAEDYWSVDGQLPFNHEDILGVLTGLLQASGVAEKRSVPERFAFRFKNATGRRTSGESMTIAAVLAVLDCMSGFSLPLLRAAAVVQLEPGGELKAVGDIRAKLEAATRECGLLSLIVCAPDSDIDGGAAAEIWQVQSLADLAGHLCSAGLLAPLLDAVGALDRRESARVLDRLRWLHREHHYRDAADLGDRVRCCGFAEPSDPAVSIEIARLHALACRHHGRFSDAVLVAREAHERVKNLGELGCDDDEADAAAEHAASLFSAHRFAKIPPLLGPWAQIVETKPRRFRPLTRIKVWNTLGRALAVLNEGGWDELFGRSLALQVRLADHENAERTAHYRIHARLRHGDLAGAREALSEAPGLCDRGAGNPWAAFLNADLARLEGRTWDDPILDERLANGKRPYSAWLYLQASARQLPRAPGDAFGRLEQAVLLLRHEAGGVNANVCNLFAALLELWAAARLQQTERWTAAREEAYSFLSVCPDHREHYGHLVDNLTATPDLATGNALLDLVPYF